MRRKWVGWFLALAATLAAPGPQGRAGEAIAVRLVRPEVQGERFIALFRGSRAANPSAALAAWKHATGGRASLGKPLEAAIAALNPAMVREWKSLDGADLRIDFAPGNGTRLWRAVLPNDDGSLAALGTALALTDGAADEPIGGITVLRLGPPGAPVSASRPGRLALASTRDGLRAALEDPDRPVPPAERDTGLHARLDPAGLRALTSVAGRRLAEALDAAGCRAVQGRLAFGGDGENDDGDALTLRVTTALEPRPRGRTGLDAAWLDPVPAAGTLAAVAVALDGSPAALDASFSLLDRVERADPARAGVAPLRARLNLLAAAARVRPEVDLWPHLRGVTAAVLVGPDGRVSGTVVALHAADDAAAARIADEVLPRLASAFAGAGKAVPAGPDGVRPLGALGGKPLSSRRRGAAAFLAWGDGALEAARSACECPEKSAGAALRAGWGATPPNRAGGFWPGRLRQLVPPGSPAARAFDRSPPVVWEGRTQEDGARDVFRWDGLRDLIRRWLDTLPLDPPPDR